MRLIKKHYVLVSIILFLIGLNVFFYFIGPEQIVQYIGVSNTYLIVFLISAIGGLSTITGTVLYTSIATFAGGGASPLFLGLAGGVGIFISDSIFFYLATRGRESIPEKWEPLFEKIQQFVDRYPLWIILIGVYLYVGFSPFPNDLLMIALAVAGIHYRHLVIALIPGSITIALVTAYFGNLWF